MFSFSMFVILVLVFSGEELNEASEEVQRADFVNSLLTTIEDDSDSLHPENSQAAYTEENEPQCYVQDANERSMLSSFYILFAYC